jgi:uncharacterized protein (DUF2141 family)
MDMGMHMKTTFARKANILAGLPTLTAAALAGMALALSPLVEAVYAETGKTLAQTAATAKLTVSFPGFKGKSGQMMVAVYQADSWLRKPMFSQKVAASPDMSVVFDALPVGTYAVSVFHDKDSNGALKTGMFGIPAEPYGFSNDAQGHMGPAVFSDASFELAAPGTSLTIKVR